MKACEIIATGNVQGVGFRRTAQKLARKFKIVGNVKNQRDGSVKIFAQGQGDKLDAFCAALKMEEPPIRVETIERRPAKLSSNLKYFEIKHGTLAEEMDEGLGAGQEQLALLRKDLRNLPVTRMTTSRL